MSKVVIPKNSATIDEVMGAMQIYYDAGSWVTNSDFIDEYKHRIGIIGDDTDSSAYTKKTEIGSYYGFLEWEDINNVKSRRRITPRGRIFLDHYNADDTDGVFADIMDSLETVEFGRNNYACKSSDSDIEPPALFLRATIDLGYLSNLEFAFLIYKMDSLGENYTDTLREIRHSRSNQSKVVIPQECNKFTDPKPIIILERWGVLCSERKDGNKVCRISSSFMSKYADRLKSLKIYNIDKNRPYDNTLKKNYESVSEDTKIMKKTLPQRSKRINKQHSLNTIIYGAPGTGKTYSTVNYALSIINNEPVDLAPKSDDERKKLMDEYNNYVDEGRIVFTTFHQSYSYEDFIQGLRPDVDADVMTFKPVDGVFKRIVEDAIKDTDSDKNYVIIIDEINRANISKVFGELITLIEEDKRWGEVNQTSAILPSGEAFAVPNNLYIIGTMNSADKSISLIDAALRRRFDFIEQKPDASLVADPMMRNVLKKMNEALADKLDSADLLIGHSYFMNKGIDELERVMNKSIIPLLYEYFYDDKKDVKSVLSDSIVNVDYVIEDDKLGRLFIERKKNDS